MGSGGTVIHKTIEGLQLVSCLFSLSTTVAVVVSSGDRKRGKG